MYERVMVPLDGTPLAERALPHAASIARRSGAEVCLVTVEEPPEMLLPDIAAPPAPGNVVADYLDEVLERLRAAGVEAARASVLPAAEVASALEAHREEIGADLTVISTHGRGPVRRVWMGSVADRLVRTTQGPVLLVRPAEDGGIVEAPDLRTDILPRRILVPLDGSPASEAAVEAAVALGRLGDAAYVLLRLVPSPPAFEPPWFPTVSVVTEEQLEAARASAEHELERVAGELVPPGLEVERVVEVSTLVAADIVDEAERRGADVIAMATHGRGGARRFVLGSVTDKVVRGARCPVLVVRS